MKKILFLLAIPIYFFTIISCNDNSSKTQLTALDSSAIINSVFSDSIRDSAFINRLDFKDLDEWKIDDSIAQAMMAWKDNCPANQQKNANTKNHRPGIYLRIWASHAFHIEQVEARYRDVDESRYSRLRDDITGHPDRGGVRNHTTTIYRVMENGLMKTPVYYDFVTICPPPYDGTCSIPRFDSTKNKK